MAENPQITPKPEVDKTAKSQELAKRIWRCIKPAILRVLAILGYVLLMGGASAGVLAGIVYIDKTYFQYINHDGLSSAEFFAGIVSIIGIALLSWRGYLLYKQVNTQIQQVGIQIAKEIDDRFNVAINLLASAETSARTGGIYSLYHIAIEHEKYRTESFLILCSHIRSKTQESEYQKQHKERPSSEIQTAIDLLLRNQNDLRGLYSVHHSTLPRVNLSNAYLVGADFSSANCQKVIFEEARCQKAFFYDADCQGAIFWGAQCYETSFENANCHGANFEEVEDIESADFADANIDGAEFDDGKTPSTKRRVD